MLDWYLGTYGDPLVMLLLPVRNYRTHCCPVVKILDPLTILTCVMFAQIKSNPPWFRVLVWNEILLQLPFFFMGV